MNEDILIFAGKEIPYRFIREITMSGSPKWKEKISIYLEYKSSQWRFTANSRCIINDEWEIIREVFSSVQERRKRFEEILKILELPSTSAELYGDGEND